MLDRRYINQLEIVINMFIVDKGKIKVLLFRRTEEPFKGYWMLPNNLLMTTETIEECTNDTIKEYTTLENLYIEQCNVFSKVDRLPNDRIIANSIICLTNNKNVEHIKTDRQLEWFNIDEIPKMVYDYSDILKDAIEKLKKRLMSDYSLLKYFYPGEFTLPELQSVFEQALNKELDRRNFRKKIINLGIVEDINIKNNVGNGRPAKLYAFKDELDNDNF